MSGALARRTPSGAVALEGAACPTTELLRSPASGARCVHWRLRVVEHLTDRMQLVHEVASEEGFELAWHPGDDRPPIQVRIDPRDALVQAAPILHREGSPGARAVAQHFGLRGLVRVEEVVIRQGEELHAEGFLDHPVDGGPFRGGGGQLPELWQAVVRVPARAVGHTLLPWALGTAAALIGGMGVAGYAIANATSRAAAAGASARPAAPRIQAEIGPRLPPRPRMP